MLLSAYRKGAQRVNLLVLVLSWASPRFPVAPTWRAREGRHFFNSLQVAELHVPAQPPSECTSTRQNQAEQQLTDNLYSGLSQVTLVVHRAYRVQARRTWTTRVHHLQPTWKSPGHYSWLPASKRVRVKMLSTCTHREWTDSRQLSSFPQQRSQTTNT